MKCREQDCLNETNITSGLCNEHIGSSAGNEIIKTITLRQLFMIPKKADKDCISCQGTGDSNFNMTAGYLRCSRCLCYMN